MRCQLAAPPKCVRWYGDGISRSISQVNHRRREVAVQSNVQHPVCQNSAIAVRVQHVRNLPSPIRQRDIHNCRHIGAESMHHGE